MNVNNIIEINPKKVKRAIMAGSQSSALSHRHSNKALLDSLTTTTLAGYDYAVEYTNNSELHGVASGMNITVNTNPRYFDISSGVYYINGTKVEYEGSTVDTISISGGMFASVIIDVLGNIELLEDSFPTITQAMDKLELTAFSKIDANTINKIGESFFTSTDFLKKVYMRHKFFEGTIFSNGSCKISANGLNLDIAGGYINTPNAESKLVTAETTVVGQEVYRVGGVYTIQPEATISLKNTQYDNGDLTTLSNNKYVVHTIARSSRVDSLYVIIGTEEFNKLEDAIEADYNLGIFSSAEGSEIEPIANIIIEEYALEPSAIVDLRNRNKVTTTALASVFDSRISDLEARVDALEGA